MRCQRGYDAWLMSPTWTLRLGRVELYIWRSRWEWLDVLWAARIVWCSGFACQWRLESNLALDDGKPSERCERYLFR